MTFAVQPRDQRGILLLGLMAAGADVLRTLACAVPKCVLCTQTITTWIGGIMVTASQTPVDHNGTENGGARSRPISSDNGT